jgi:hypothetical protein
VELDARPRTRITAPSFFSVEYGTEPQRFKIRTPDPLSQNANRRRPVLGMEEFHPPTKDALATRERRANPRIFRVSTIRFVPPPLDDALNTFRSLALDLFAFCGLDTYLSSFVSFTIQRFGLVQKDSSHFLLSLLVLDLSTICQSFRLPHKIDLGIQSILSSSFPSKTTSSLLARATC